MKLKTPQTKTALVTALTALTVAFTSTPALAAPGDADASFGEDGYQVSTCTDSLESYSYGYESYVDSETGNILVAGACSHDTREVTLTAYSPDGLLVEDFGTGGGWAVYDLVEEAQEYRGAFAQDKADGDILAVIKAQSHDPELVNNYLMARYNSDGSLDESFGDGTGVVDIEADIETIFDLQIDEETQLIYMSANDQIRRYLPNGELDASFGTDGMVEYADAAWRQFRVNPITKEIVGLGYESSLDGLGRHDTNIRVFGLNADGSINESFGRGGMTKLDAPTRLRIFANDMELLEDGSVVILGDLSLSVWRPFDPGSMLIKLNADGSFDGGFGRDGKLRLEKTLTELAVDEASNKILVAGDAWNYSISGSEIIMARFNLDDGTIDESFGEAGFVQTLISGTTSNNVSGLTIDPAASAIYVTGFADIDLLDYEHQFLGKFDW